MNKYPLLGCLAGHRLENAGPVIPGARIGDLEDRFDETEWDGLIDTGANVSVVPLETCQALYLHPDDFKPAAGFDGTSRLAPLYNVRIALPGLEPVCVCALGVARRSILLGRDFMQGMIFAMDSRRSRFALGRWSALRRVFFDLLSRV